MFRILNPFLLPCALLLLGAGPLTGCVGASLGAGAAAGVSVVQERSVGDAIDDVTIRLRINDLWFSENFDLYRRVELQVLEGRVLLSGSVDDPRTRLDAVRLAWQVKGVKEVIDEIEVSGVSSFGEDAQDGWISAQLRTKMMFDKDIRAINYSIETVKGVVYLMGVAQDSAELERVTNHARNLSHVKRVVSYVRIKDDPERRAELDSR
jgi:osmotically-inducible protein OsmY